jgi:hypothetical protein
VTQVTVGREITNFGFLRCGAVLWHASKVASDYCVMDVASVVDAVSEEVAVSPSPVLEVAVDDAPAMA